jgi:hypothetical protein
MISVYAQLLPVHYIYVCACARFAERCPCAGGQTYAARAPSQTSRSHKLRLHDTRDRHHCSPEHLRCSTGTAQAVESSRALSAALCLKGRELCTKGTTAAGLTRLAGSALAERVQRSGQLGAKVVRGGLQQGGVTPHLGLALVLLGVRLRCVVEPLDPLLITARKEFPARSRVEAALWCFLPEGVR